MTGHGGGDGRLVVAGRLQHVGMGSTGRWRRLVWDSDFFGFGIGRIELPACDREVLAAIHQEARQQTVELLYWPTMDDQATTSVAIGYGARLVDRKTVFERGLDDVAEATALPEPRGEERDRLLEMAPLAGVCSRFACDPRLPVGSMPRLYRRWMERSLDGVAADVVLCYRWAGELAGFVTVTCSDQIATIGLVAVDPEHRGKGIGGELVRGAEAWAAAQGGRCMRIVTQEDNEAACRLYRRLGYRRCSVVPWYHVWTDCSAGR